MKISETAVEAIRNKKGYIIDMDGVIYHGNRVLPGAKEFVDWLTRENKNFLFRSQQCWIFIQMDKSEKR